MIKGEGDNNKFDDMDSNGSYMVQRHGDGTEIKKGGYIEGEDNKDLESDGSYMIRGKGNNNVFDDMQSDASYMIKPIQENIKQLDDSDDEADKYSEGT